MEAYLLIISRDPFAGREAERAYGLAADLARRGHPVTVFLVQNGVLPARRGAAATPLAQLAERGVRVVADELSLRERGIVGDRLASGIEAGPIDLVVDALADGARALWH